MASKLLSQNHRYEIFFNLSDSLTRVVWNTFTHNLSRIRSFIRLFNGSLLMTIVVKHLTRRYRARWPITFYYLIIVNFDTIWYNAEYSPSPGLRRFYVSHTHKETYIEKTLRPEPCWELMASGPRYWCRIIPRNKLFSNTFWGIHYDKN